MTQSIREKAIEAMAQGMAGESEFCLDAIGEMNMRMIAAAAFDAAVKVLMEPTAEVIEACRWPAEDDGPAACWTAMLKAASQ